MRKFTAECKAEQGLSELKPVKITRRIFEKSLEVCLHYHWSLEINYSSPLIEGSITVKGESHDLASHPIILLPPGTIHSYKIHANPGHMFVLHISLEDLRAYFNLDKIYEVMGLELESLPLFDPGYDRMIPILEEMQDTMEETHHLSLVLDLFSKLGLIKLNSGHFDPVRDNKLITIMEYTRSHLSEDITIDRISAASGISRNYFCHFFKKHTSFTYWHYLRQSRIEHAEENLRTGANVAESGYSSGFDDPSYFIRVYKKSRGITPGEYRRRWRELQISGGN